jgi:hypothetical protein
MGCPGEGWDDDDDEEEKEEEEKNRRLETVTITKRGAPPAVMTSTMITMTTLMTTGPMLSGVQAGPVGQRLLRLPKYRL